MSMMKSRQIAFFALLALVALVAFPIAAEDHEEMEQHHEPGEMLVSIYSVAPGQHMAFLEWQAENEAVAEEAGVPSAHWFAHLDGASWDFVTIGAVTTDEQDAKIEEINKKRGRKTGFAGAIEFRTFVASHTDTFAFGPTSATALLAAAKAMD